MESVVSKRTIKNMDVSILGFGGMRFPVANGEIDQDNLNNMVDYAILHGVNYFDTAYIYHEGKSEEAFGKALRKYDRSKYLVADKMPVWECKNTEDVERIFDEQLKRTGLEYFDFYLAHSLGEDNYKLFEEHNVYEFMLKKQEEGKIKNIGFSFHGTPEKLKEILGKYKFDFAQIQLNYYDWTMQKAKEQYEILEKYNLPCIVMEGARGGFLSNFSDEINKIYTDARPSDSISSWAFRWLISLPNVYVVLSGMSNMEQVEDNINIFSKNEKYSENDYEVVEKVLDKLNGNKVIPCTGCRYCMDCQFRVDIPRVFSIYNDYQKTKNDFMVEITYGETMKESERAHNCTECGACKKHCPQNIDIPNELKKVKEVFGKIVE